MHFEGTFDTKASKEEVWSFMMDPNSVAQCLPGLEKLEIVDADNFNAKVRIGISFIKGIFDFKIRTFDRQTPKHVSLVAHGKGVGSTIDVETVLDMTELEGGGTRMSWNAEAQVGGVIAGVSKDLMNRAGQKVVNELFEGMKFRMEKSQHGDSS